MLILSFEGLVLFFDILNVSSQFSVTSMFALSAFLNVLVLNTMRGGSGGVC
jgi:hypothetical protein